jgi:mannitol-1-phosphate 5-dehydrogenase
LNKTALIFGAGKTGRGFAAHLAFLGGYDIILVDKNEQLVSDLSATGQYEIQVLDNEERNCTIKTEAAYHIDDRSWQDKFVETSLVFTAVFGNNLEALAQDVAPALERRFVENHHALLTIITCENLTDAVGVLKKAVTKHLDAEQETWLAQAVGFSESIIFRTCLEASADQSPLTIRAQNFFELPCDADEIKEALTVYGLKPLKNFKHQLRRKIYTYNCINAVITYLGAQKGYTQLYEAGNDAEILAAASKAANETSRALIAEYSFDLKEQEEWTTAAFAKFADRNIPDPIDRNVADPERKLGREDRLIGPALLALKHGIYPAGLLTGIMACFDYEDPIKNYRIADKIRDYGPDHVLQEVCGLSKEEELFSIIKEEIVTANLDAKH